MASVGEFPGHVYRRVGRDFCVPSVKRSKKIGWYCCSSSSPNFFCRKSLLMDVFEQWSVDMWLWKIEKIPKKHLITQSWIVSSPPSKAHFGDIIFRSCLHRRCLWCLSRCPQRECNGLEKKGGSHQQPLGTYQFCTGKTVFLGDLV